jgi:hypothetical protein
MNEVSSPLPPLSLTIPRSKPHLNSLLQPQLTPPPAFLSYLRLSLYMSIVSIAIVISFHLKSQPSRLELRMAKPLGIIFWGLSVSCLFLGFGNYVKTVNKYSRRAAIVQTGWKTQTVSSPIFNREEQGRDCVTWEKRK